jgi:hypothetical protein
MNTISNEYITDEKDASVASAEGLELFAEDLPTEHDLKGISCLGCFASASSFGGTVGTASTFSCG